MNTNATDRFPDLQPVSKAPSLSSINGVGFGIYGARDHDAETQTYVKTHCLTFLYIPLLAIGAYRVAKADNGGWYFLGKEPMSVVAKAFNALVIVVLFSGIGYWGYEKTYNSPNAIADRKIAQAEKDFAEGNVVDGANLYRDVLYGTSERTNAARFKLSKLHEDQSVTAANLSDVAEVFKIELATRENSFGDPTGVAVFESAIKLVDDRGDEDLASANILLEAVKPVISDPEKYHGARKRILEDLVKTEPANLELASQLAESLEYAGETERCVSLLEPHLKELGETEGARILGQIWASEGKLDEAYGLLAPYCESRLPKLTVAEAKLNSIYDAEYAKVIRSLENGEATERFYREYDNSSEAKQNVMVQEYIDDELADNRKIDEARQNYIELTGVVPVALDLGMVTLRRAQMMANKEQQVAELEKAETTFKSIRSVAGGSDEFRLYLGQVNYWLGKYEEGKLLFNELLAANNRGPQYLMMVGTTIRGVGRSAEAREMFEEAYEKATDQKLKNSAAALRSTDSLDLDDELLWLKRCDLEEPGTAARYKATLGDQASQNGKPDEAEKFYRDALAAFDKLPESTAMLNNSALTCFSLYQTTSDQADYKEGVRRIEKAVSMSPTDSILRSNAAHILLVSAYRDTIDDQIDLVSAKAEPNQDMLSYLYANQTEKSAFAKTLNEHAGMKRAIDLLDNVLLLAPKRGSSYTRLANLYDFQRDVEALSELRDQIDKAEPNVENDRVLEFYSEAGAEKYRERFSTVVKDALEQLNDTQEGDRTYDFTLGSTLESHLALSTFQDEIDIDSLISKTEVAYSKRPSAGLRSALINGLLLRAHVGLLKSNPEYSKMVARAKRTMSASHNIAIAMSRDEQLAKQVAKHPDVAKALELSKEANAAFPGLGTGWGWALYRFQDPEYAKQLADELGKNQVDEMYLEINRKLSPAIVSYAMDAYWRLMAQGKTQEANAVLKSCAATGAPLPFDVE